MEKIYVVYWSQSGNTEAMAEAIGEGVKEAGKEAVVTEISGVSLEDLKAADGFALGCPAMGDEELDDSEMEPFVSEVEKFAAGKTIGLFGSYGWGDGEWMTAWVARMEKAGASVPGGQGTICQEAPDEDAAAACMELGRKLAAL